MFGQASLRPPKPCACRRRPPTRLAVEQLDERTVPAAFTVSTLQDSGLGSLRQAILDANATAGDDAIVFQPGLAGTITLTGSLDVSDSVTIQGPGAGVLAVSGNHASRIFLVYDGTPTAINVAIRGLTLTAGSGEAVAVSGEVLTLRGVVITKSNAKGGGGISVSDDGQLTLEDSTVSGNKATVIGGGLYLGLNSVALIRNSTISGNQAEGVGVGGGVGGGAFVDRGASLTVENSTISGNTATGGSGGVFVKDRGSLTVENSTISGNQVTAGSGGGISAQGTVVVRNSTISGNSADFGGGITVLTPALASSSLTVENSTISGNAARSDGGGILTEGGAVTLRNSTVAFNTADSDNLGGGNGGGLFVSGPASVTLQSTIVADNAVVLTGADPDVSGPVTATFSLVENTAGTVFAPGSVANLLGLDPRLGPLTDNGGPTKTHALLAGSPAIDHGSNPAGLAFDQRGPGFARVRGTAPDIGAFEAAPAPQIVAVPFRRNGVAQVRVFDAAAGTVRAILTPFHGFGGRLRLQLVDINGDGSADLIVKALVHGRRRKKAFDAVTLARLPPGLA